MERKKNRIQLFFNVQFNGIVKCNSGSCVECVSRCVGKLCSISVNIFAKGNKSARCARKSIWMWMEYLEMEYYFECDRSWFDTHKHTHIYPHSTHTHTPSGERDACVVKSVTTQFGYEIANSLRHSMCFSYERNFQYILCIPIDGNYISEREHPHYVNSVIYIEHSTCVVCMCVWYDLGIMSCVFVPLRVCKSRCVCMHWHELVLAHIQFQLISDSNKSTSA